MTWPLLFFAFALLLFALATIGVNGSKFQTGWAGMFFVALGMLWPNLPK